MSLSLPFSPNDIAGRSRSRRSCSLTPDVPAARAGPPACASRPRSPTGAKSDAARPAAPQTTGAQCRRRRPGQSIGAKEPHRQGDRQGQGSREIGRRHFQPRALPAAEGRAPDRWDRCRTWRASSPPAQPVVIVAFGSSSTTGYGATVARLHTIPTGWRRSCAGNIRPPTSPWSTAATAARTRRR